MGTDGGTYGSSKYDLKSDSQNQETKTSVHKQQKLIPELGRLSETTPE